MPIRFSIRSLLAILLLCGILFPLIQSMHGVQRDLATNLRLKNEIEVLRTRLDSENETTLQLRAHQAELFDSIERMRQRSVEQFERMQQEYGRVQPVGPDTFSIRSVPQLSPNGQRAPTVFRLHVPNGRDVWLKYAIVPADSNSSQTSKRLDQFSEPVKGTGFQHQGPFESKLSAGEQILTINVGNPVHHLLPIEVRVGDQLMIGTQYSGRHDVSSGMSYIGGTKQLDYPRNRDLPWLMSLHVDERTTTGSQEKVPFRVTIWLSDRSSGFDPFPGTVDATDSRGSTR